MPRPTHHIPFLVFRLTSPHCPFLAWELVLFNFSHFFRSLLPKILRQPSLFPHLQPFFCGSSEVFTVFSCTYSATLLFILLLFIFPWDNFCLFLTETTTTKHSPPPSWTSRLGLRLFDGPGFCFIFASCDSPSLAHRSSVLWLAVAPFLAIDQCHLSGPF